MATKSEETVIDSSTALRPLPRLSSNDPNDHSSTETAAGAPADDTSRHLHGKDLLFVFIGLLLTMLLIALDQTIVSTAIPAITSHFDDLDDVTWIIGAYLLTQVAFLLTYGQILTIVATKWVFMFTVFVFELGSLFCGIAQSSKFLIFGRAVAGVGAGGIFVSSFSIIAETVRVDRRPLLLSTTAVVFGLSSVMGPLIGGAFTDNVSWRWCFYINIPIGFVAFLFIAVFVPNRGPIGAKQGEVERKGGGWKRFWRGMRGVDWVGSLLCLAFVVCLVLALQWGGSTYAWDSAPVIVCFVLFVVLAAVFLGWEWYKGDTGILPLKLLARRTQAGCTLIIFFSTVDILVFTYYLPIQYQAVEGVSATKSGVDILPFMLAVVITGGSTGALISYFGRYWHVLVIGPCCCAIGAGLLYTTSVDTPTANLIGYQILYGVGVGSTMQNTIVPCQADVDSPHLVPQATAILSFGQFMGGVIGISAAGSVFDNSLARYVKQYAPSAPSGVTGSVSDIRALVPAGSVRDAVVHAYVRALDDVYLIGVAAGTLTILSALIVRNLNLKNLKTDPGMIAMA